MITDNQIRWLIRPDMPEVLRIDNASFSSPWTDEDFLRCLRQRNCIGMVAAHEHHIMGFMIYELHESRFNILNFAVAPDFRRQGIGLQMVRRLIDKLSQQRRNEIMLEVRERNLDAQIFFRKQGFRATSVLRKHYDDGEDAIAMRYCLPEVYHDTSVHVLPLLAIAASVDGVPRLQVNTPAGIRFVDLIKLVEALEKLDGMQGVVTA